VKITFIRHGNTNKAENDLDRQLTKLGIQQAQERRQALLNPKFDLVFSSIADRARDTAAIIAGIKASEVILLEELYLPKNPVDKKAIDDMFAALGYSPLRAYRDADVTGALIRYGMNGAMAIFSAIFTEETKNNIFVDNVLVVGSAVLTNAIVSAVASGDTDLILDAALGEAEGISVTMDGDGVAIAVELVR
jgi:broad specificity phosphatase PhoE